MPQTIEEESNTNQTTDSPSKIISLWKKFHFSGRVIMCSVLFGLGLVLIGGLIFVINVDDGSNNPDSKGEKDSEIDLPTKPPSSYVGPVVMGIGGFIVIVGVIMCLFETQVCRKKTGDSSPLISGKTDDEGRISEPPAIPSTSKCHKNHKHKSRDLVKKSKNRHAKSNEHKQQKMPSSKSPPIFIDKPKGLLTSSEDNFLTPPSTLDDQAALKRRISRDAENQTSTSLMKSFTSSGTSWNKSSEFLTPSTSFRDTSGSVENSVEIDEKQGQVNFAASQVPQKEYTNPEYMTPFTVEDKVQKLYINLKNEREELAKREEEGRLSAMNSATDKDSEMHNVAENIIIPTDEFKENKNNHEDNFVFDKNLPQNIDAKEESSSAVGNYEVDGVTDANILNDSKEKLNLQENEKKQLVTPLDPPKSSIDKNRDESDLAPVIEMRKNNENDMELDLEGSTSSEETIVSRDSSIESPKNNEIVENTKSMDKESFSAELRIENVQESLGNDKSATSNSSTNHQKIPSDIRKDEDSEVSDHIHSEINAKEDKNMESHHQDIPSGVKKEDDPRDLSLSEVDVKKDESLEKESKENFS